LPQHQEVQNIGHVMVLNCEILSCKSAIFIHQCELQTAESRGSNLILDANHLHELMSLDTRMSLVKISLPPQIIQLSCISSWVFASCCVCVRDQVMRVFIHLRNVTIEC
jgi:hypothetical protein